MGRRGCRVQYLLFTDESVILLAGTVSTHFIIRYCANKTGYGEDKFASHLLFFFLPSVFYVKSEIVSRRYVIRNYASKAELK